MTRGGVFVLAWLLTLGCQSSDDDGSGSGGGGSGGSAQGGATTAGMAGSGAPNTNGGTTSTTGGAASGGSTNTQGGVANGGSNNAQGGVASGGRGGFGRGGASSGGNANAGGKTSAGGASAAGTAGSDGCVPNPGCKLTAPASSGDIYQDCVDRINQFRTQCACLPALERWTDGEACANQEAQYDSEKNSAHAGFMDKICSSGNAQDECPSWGSNTQVISGCLQQMWDEGPPPTMPCNDSCFQMYGHYINMSSTSSKRVACGFYTTPSGKVWAVQNFTR